MSTGTGVQRPLTQLSGTRTPKRPPAGASVFGFHTPDALSGEPLRIEPHLPCSERLPSDTAENRLFSFSSTVKADAYTTLTQDYAAVVLKTCYR